MPTGAKTLITTINNSFLVNQSSIKFEVGDCVMCEVTGTH